MKEKEYFELSLESLRILGRWAADCAERVLPIYEETIPGDSRPRNAIEGIRQFADGGNRTAALRVLAMDAYRAALEAKDPSASAAARAASMAAASAYTHPLVDVAQTKHVLGPAAYAALAMEIRHGDDTLYGDAEIQWAIAHSQNEIGEILRKMPAREPGKSRLDKLMFDLDRGLRGLVKSG